MAKFVCGLNQSGTADGSVVLSIHVPGSLLLEPFKASPARSKRFPVSPPTSTMPLTPRFSASSTV
jgi:hypothetical protein